MDTLTTLRRDARHHLDGPFYSKRAEVTPLKVLQLALAPEFALVVAFRTYSALYRRGSRMVAYALYLATKWLFGCDLAMEATIGPGLRVGHAQDVVIGSTARIGRDCIVFNGVTLGNRYSGQPSAQPDVGDGVLIGTGAKLLGPITIGDNARIGANSVVLDDVPAGATAVGNPATVRARD